jgi:hypothetical protein
MTAFAQSRSILLQRTIASWVFLITALLIGLGGLGHGSHWRRHIAPALDGKITDPHLLGLFMVVWLFVSGCMLTFAALLVFTWLKFKKGDKSLAVIPYTVGTLYLVTGVICGLGVAPFFYVFLVLGLLLLVSARVLAGP